MNSLIQKVQSHIRDSKDFNNFLVQIDLLQQSGLDKLIKAGIGEEYSQAFLLKISNFLVGKYQYVNRCSYLISSPYSLIVDPSNNCQLHCPGCLHNKIFQKKIGTDWPSGMLAPTRYDTFISEFGPYASSILFYNWGEPLLNQHTPEFIKKAKSYLLNTVLSSNLSIKFDAEALVTSGLDYMILSIDGATQASYEYYRKGGKFDLVMNNVRLLVEAKKKYRMATPVLSWQFLLFEHNKHEKNKVKEIANELGVNEVHFANPYDIIWNDDLRIATKEKEERYVTENPGGGSISLKPSISGSFKKLFSERWQDKAHGIKKSVFRKKLGLTCKWLYTSLVMDATARYLPCCYAPRKQAGFTYIFSDSSNGDTSPFNSQYYQFSREHFVWLSNLKEPDGIAPILKNGGYATYCVSCPDAHNNPLVNTFHLQRYLTRLDEKSLLNRESIKIVSNWDYL